MKCNLQIIISASAASVMAFSALAEDTSKPKKERALDSRDRTHQSEAGRLNGAAKASDIIGMTVKSYQDKTLGQVQDFAVDVESGRIVQVILSTGGLAGMGDRLTAVPPGAMKSIQDVARIGLAAVWFGGVRILSRTVGIQMNSS